MKSRLKELQERLARIEAERANLQAEIRLLKAAEAPLPSAKTDLPATPLGCPTRSSPPVSNVEKIELFLTLFRCREDVYPKRWESTKTGKQGYSPACANEWKPGICGKPKVKCADCGNRAFEPLDARTVEAHMKGEPTIGTYAIREDDTCIFLACDFDGDGWKEDAGAYRRIAKHLGIEVGLERSRSGNGAHAWIFFAEPVPAREARMLGTLILSKAQEDRHQIGYGTYDRFFPNQDVLPKGGFGNLIALPLQSKPSMKGNSLFLDENFTAISGQLSYLASVRRLSFDELRGVLRQYLPSPPQSPRSRAPLGDGEEDAALLVDDALLNTKAKGQTDKDTHFDLEGRTIEIGFGAMVQVPLQDLSSRMITRLKRLASFANPEFYKLQRMRMPTFPHQRFIFSGELRADVLLLPRGCLEKVQKTLTDAGADVVIRDERLGRKRLKVEFTGQLTEDQEKAVAAMAKHDTGVLVAPPGAGKTVMGCALIAKRKVTTLILVHRQPLLEQWKERLQTFLGLGTKEIGVLGGAKKKPTGKIDLAMLQTLTRMENLEEIAESYAQIIIDEAHHIPAASFEGVMKVLPARYVVGLTATPYRKDGLQKILFQQCGEIRHTIQSTDGGKLQKKVIIRETGYRLREDLGPKPDYHVLLHALTTDAGRNRLIAGDVAIALESGRFPALISDRKEHLDFLEREIADKAKDIPALASLQIIRLVGDLGKKARREARERLDQCREQGTPVLLLATGSLIGEGFDLPALDTLVIATPLSFKGRMVQYAGRLHRLIEGKGDVLIHDYVDSSVAMCIGMYRKRVIAYRGMGYSVDEPHSLLGPRSFRQAGLFG